MRVAFYAPLKSPDHPVPSGDRLIARLLLRALEHAGHTPEVPARLRSYDGVGDRARQRRLARLGARLAARVVRRVRARAPIDRPRAWLTYHLYHKAPDRIGPAVCDALGIPYLVVEASHAEKQQGGPWDDGLRACAAALARAAAVVVLNSTDLPGVRPLVRPDARLVRMAPFLDAAPFAALPPGPGARTDLARAWDVDAELPWIACVAMMRPGNKLDSYRVLARALARVDSAGWCLLVAGDGPARARVEEALRPLGRRARLLGPLVPSDVRGLLAAADVFAWPAVSEPIGMAFLEAQAAGLPVVAGCSRGVPDVVRHGETGVLVPPGDADAFAAALGGLLADPDRRARLGAAGRRRVLGHHDLPAAAGLLDAVLREVAGRGAAA